MTAVHVGTFEPGSVGWHAARARGIGGSEISAVLGLSPFESRFSLWHRKGGAIGPVELTDVMEWGTRLEGAVIRKWADEHPEHNVLHQPGTYARDDWMIANPDAIVSLAGHSSIDEEVLEVKTSPFGDGWGDAGTDDVPVHVRIQTLWYLGVLGLQVGHIAVLIGGHDYREYRIEFDADEFQLLADAGAEFMASLERNERPDIDERSATYQAIRELHPDIDPLDVELTDETALRYLIARDHLKRATANEQHARSLVADEMGTAQRATWFHDGQLWTLASRQARGDGTPFVKVGRRLPDLNSTTTREDTAA